MRRIAGALWLRVLLFGGAYLALAMAGGMVSAGFGDVPVFWPAAGLSVAVLLRSPRRHWPAYLVAVAVCDLIVHPLSGASPQLAAVFATCDVVEPLLGALLLTRLAGERRTRVDSPRDALRFILACAAVPTLVAGVVGGGAVWLVDGGALGERLYTYWAADAIGVMAVGTAVLLVGRGEVAARAMTWRLELAGGVVVTAIAGLWVFGSGGGEGHWAYAALAPAILLAIRFGGVGS